MRNIDPSLKAHLEQNATTTCRCWKVIRSDGVELGFTDHDRELILAGFSFEPATGFDSSVMESSSGFSADGGEVLGALTSNSIESADLRAGKYDGASVEIYFVNWQQPAQNLLEHVLRVGKIVEEDGVFKANLESLPAELDQTKGRHFIKECQAELGDIKCGIDLESPLYKVAGIVSSVSGIRVFETNGATQFDSGWFDNGHVLWTGGENAGLSVPIQTHLLADTSSSIKLWFDPAGTIAEGDAFELVAGCDKRFETCRNKFSNSLNFRGFPHLPGEEYALSYPDRRKPMDGGVIVP